MKNEKTTREAVLANPDWAAEKIDFLRERVASLETAMGAANPGDHSDAPIEVRMELPAGGSRAARQRVG